MKVSVIIPAYNYGRFIADALDAVLAQTRRPDEVVIVDDGSTDDTETVVRSYLGDRQGAGRGVAIKYIKQANAGVCAARNRGVAEAVGGLIAFADADDIWHPEKLEKQIAKFDADGRVGLVHCGMREFDSETGETLGHILVGGEHDVWRNLLLWDGPAVVGPGGTIVVTRQAFETAGGFDTRQKVGEDWDLCYRIARKFEVRFVAEPLVDYRSHAASAHHNVSEMERGMLLFLEKAFTENAAEVQQLRRRAYGSVHRVLAGSHFRVGNYGRFAANALKSIFYWPSGIGYFAAYPLRLFSRRQN